MPRYIMSNSCISIFCHYISIPLHFEYCTLFPHYIYLITEVTSYFADRMLHESQSNTLFKVKLSRKCNLGFFLSLYMSQSVV